VAADVVAFVDPAHRARGAGAAEVNGDHERLAGRELGLPEHLFQAPGGMASFTTCGLSMSWHYRRFVVDGLDKRSLSRASA
jgi:hypothetical protein